VFCATYLKGISRECAECMVVAPNSGLAIAIAIDVSFVHPAAKTHSASVAAEASAEVSVKNVEKRRRQGKNGDIGGGAVVPLTMEA
jgi:hypothetical protein